MGMAQVQMLMEAMQDHPQAKKMMLMLQDPNISEAKKKHIQRLVTSPHSTLMPKPVVFNRAKSTLDLTFGAMLRPDTLRVLAMSTVLTFIFCYGYVLYLHIRRAPPREYAIMMASVYRLNALMVCGTLVLRMLMK